MRKNHFTLNAWSKLLSCVAILLIIVIDVTSTVFAQEGVSIVGSQWLDDQRQIQNIIILDTRPENEYLHGHIDRAINIPVDKTFRQTGKTKRVLSVIDIQNLLGDAGISNDDFIVVYDGGEYINAGRMFWVLEVYGHQKLALLNGGYPGWLKNEYPINSEPHTFAKATYIASIQPNRLATKFQTSLATNDAKRIIVDARSSNEYLGKESKAKRAGHIPTATNIPWDLNFETNDGVPVIKDFAELRNVYKNIKDKEKVITYCNAGKHSSFTYFILRQLGHDVSHYDGSWLEWGNDVSLPIENVDAR